MYIKIYHLKAQPSGKESGELSWEPTSRVSPPLTPFMEHWLPWPALLSKKKKKKLKLQSVPVCCAAHCGRLCSVEAHFIPSGHWPGQWRRGQCWVEAHCTVAHDTNACHPLMSCSLLSGDTLTSDHILIYVFVFTVYLIFMNVTVYHLKAEHSP